MTDYTIPMIIGMTLAFVLGVGFGFLFGLSRHEWLYCRVTAHLTRRMREAMQSLGIEEWQIDKVHQYMGNLIIPPYIPMPAPPPTTDEKLTAQKICVSFDWMVTSDDDKELARSIALRCAKMLHNAASRGDQHELELIADRMANEWRLTMHTTMVGERPRVTINVPAYSSDGHVYVLCDIVKEG